MEVIDRKENPLLNRVEIRFLWNHDNSPPPSLKEMVAAAAKVEPGAKESLTLVKEVSTRFGRSQTTGMALVYSSKESFEFEMGEEGSNRWKRAMRARGMKEAPKAKPVKVEPAVEEPAEEPVEEAVEEPAEEQSEGGDE